MIKRLFNPEWAQDKQHYLCECGYCGQHFDSLQEDDTTCPECAMVSYQNKESK
jgi:hypothetical protein